MIRGKVVLSRGYFLKCGHLAIPAKLHGPKGDRINESLLYCSFSTYLSIAVLVIGIPDSKEVALS